jgi:hypothetical protein
MSILLPRSARPLAILAAPPPAMAARASLADAWDEVEVREAELRPCPDDPHRRARVRACIRLGVLLPVDVTVDVVPKHGQPPGVRCRLFGVQPLAGGAYVFEGTTRLDDLGRQGFEIRVGPATRTGGVPPVPPVVRRFATP